MRKVVINKCFGGFGLSYRATMRYAELAGFRLWAFTAGGGADLKNRKFTPYDGLSEAFVIHYAKKPLRVDGSYDDSLHFSDDDIPRDDPNLVLVVEELGEAANGSCADLKVVEIPDDVDWRIDEYDGLESVEEAHRSWS